MGLVDTHAFIWWDSDPGRLSAQAFAFLQDPANVVWLSAASVWEIAIKHQLGKLQLHLPLIQILNKQQANGMQLLPVQVRHALEVEHLPLIHKDPFDRMLVAQARVEGAALVSGDTILKQYPVQVVW